MLDIIYELANSGIKTQLNNNFKFKRYQYHEFELVSTVEGFKK
jgi:hypothetical protein